jgi:hypothetical protein
MSRTFREDRNIENRVRGHGPSRPGHYRNAPPTISGRDQAKDPFWSGIVGDNGLFIAADKLHVDIGDRVFACNSSVHTFAVPIDIFVDPAFEETPALPFLLGPNNANSY